jgi:hypothetical protein
MISQNINNIQTLSYIPHPENHQADLSHHVGEIARQCQPSLVVATNAFVPQKPLPHVISALEKAFAVQKQECLEQASTSSSVKLEALTALESRNFQPRSGAELQIRLTGKAIGGSSSGRRNMDARRRELLIEIDRLQEDYDAKMRQVSDIEYRVRPRLIEAIHSAEPGSSVQNALVAQLESCTNDYVYVMGLAAAIRLRTDQLREDLRSLG